MDVSRRGMTLLELTFGLFSLGVLGLAAVGVMAAAASAWDTRDHYREQVDGVRTITSRLGQWVRQSKRVVSVNTNSGITDVVLWTDDAYFAGQVNLAEIKVISYDSATDRLTLYMSNLTAAEKAGVTNVEFLPVVAGASGFGPAFRALPAVSGYVMAEGVVSFNAAPGTGMVSSPNYGYLHVTLTAAGPGGTADQAASIGVAVRVPNKTIAFGP